MKKFFVYVTAVLIAASCTSALDERVSQLEKTVAEIQSQINAINNDIKSLQELFKSRTVITDYSNNDGVWTLTLGDGTVVTVSNGEKGDKGDKGEKGDKGDAGQTPVVSAKQDTDGILYWTVNGEWLLVGGKKVPVTGADGQTPVLGTNENGQYTLTIGGQTVVVSGNDGADGDAMFSDVILAEDGSSITFVLADGQTEVVVPIVSFKLNIANTENIVIVPGKSVEVAYTISGACEHTQVYTICEGGFTAEVKAETASNGVIIITAPATINGGKVLVFAGDESHAGIVGLTFEEGKLNVVEAVEVGSEGGNVEFSVNTNLDYEIAISESWLTQAPATKAMREDKLTFVAQANAAAARTATITLTSGSFVKTVLVSQAGAPAVVQLKDLIGTYAATYTNRDGAASEGEIVIVASDDQSKGNFKITKFCEYEDVVIYGTLDLYTGVLSFPKAIAKDNLYFFVMTNRSDWNSVTALTMQFSEGTISGASHVFGFGPASSFGPTPISTYSNFSAVKQVAQGPDYSTAKVGDFFYSDGTFSTALDADKTLVGVIFHLGDATADDAILKKEHEDCTHGLVVGVERKSFAAMATRGYMVYQTVFAGQNLAAEGYVTTQTTTNSGPQFEKCLGYQNTKMWNMYEDLIPYSCNVPTNLQSFARTYPCPETASGWYIPSVLELAYLVEGDDADPKTCYSWGTSFTCDNLDIVNASLTAAGKAIFQKNWSYGTSSEAAGNNTIWGFSSSYKTIDSLTKSASNNFQFVFAF